jgi:serine/threonine protein kinase/Tol biopolymer transport system component
MSTAPKQLGPYEIVAPLGSGGMGDVYRAKDTRLGREVALKILRGDVANDADRRARFEREARTVAALSHPNIVALFEVGNADGVEYTVSELVDGESLRGLLKDGALPVRRVVELATQLADGMAAAHAAGIVHRDLKPENVMVTRDGRVKILDFGLARQTVAGFGSGSSSSSGASASSSAETMVVPAQTMIHASSSAATQYMTSPGMVLGTAAYMSPEQAKGLEADYRSDQFSFGLMVYEMLSGKQAFVRGSAVETMAAIVRDEPEPLDGKIPVTLRWAVERCLEKDPGQRFDSTKDLYQQLRMLRDHFSEAFSSSMSGIAAVSAEVAAAQTVVKSKVPVYIWPTLLLIGLLLGAAATWLVKPSGADLSKYKYTPFAVNAVDPLWSPDGKEAAYAGVTPDGRELFLRALNSNTSQQLTHVTGEVRPIAWSADSSHIYYLASMPAQKDVKLMSIGTVGGEPDTLWTLPAHQFEWNVAFAISPDGKAAALLNQGADGQYDVYISQPIGAPLQRYPNSGVASRDIYNGPKMQFSPDGKQVLLIRAGDSNSEEAWLLPWPAGSGKPHQVLKDLPREGGTTPFAWMPDNRHVVLAGTSDIASSDHLYLADTQSDAMRQITQGTGEEYTMSVAPDGALLFNQMRGQSDIVAMSVTDGTVKPVIVTGMQENMPAWASHANAMVYASTRLGPQDLWLHTEDGAGNATERPLITREMFGANPPKWMFAPVLSPDGQRVIFIAVPQTADTGKSAVPKLWEASVAGGAPVPLVDASDPDTEFAGDWSPDGNRFVYMALEGGTAKLKIVRTSGGAKPQLLAEHIDDAVPSWSPDGQWIFYRDDEGVDHLISPDGTRHRDLGKFDTYSMGWARDSKTLYGIREDDGKYFAFSLDVASDPAKLHDIRQIDASQQPSSNLNPSIRFTLTPDGKSFVYAMRKREVSIWMLTGWQ